MLRRDASSVFRSVLLLSAVGTACGGAIEKQPGEAANEDPPTTTGSSSSSTSSGSSSGGSSSSSSTSSSGSTSSSSSGSTSSSSSSSSGGSSGGYSCVNGKTAMTEAFCCAPGTTCLNSGGSGDATDGGIGCEVDCARVCAAMAPGVQGGFDACYPQPGGEVGYLCGACGVGRLPNDTELCPLGDTIAERLARQAYYEGVSVVAFERLAAVLEAAGAPSSLVNRARDAAADEARHAAIFRDLALVHGASTRATPEMRSVPTLFELALENATEGCVRETFGAVITLHQATYAESDAVREAYAAICEDEAEHAALSWELKAWFDTQLTAEQRAHVDRAHRHALEAAARESLEAPDAPGLALGLPAPARARKMLDLVVDAMANAA